MMIDLKTFRKRLGRHTKDLDLYHELSPEEKEIFSLEYEKAKIDIESMDAEERRRRHLDKWKIEEVWAMAIGRMIFETKRNKQYLLRECQVPSSIWRDWILDQNDFTCMMCGLYDWTGNRLHAHHIYPVSKYPELSRDGGNGIVLCIPCHRSIRGIEEQLVEHLLSKVDYGPTLEEDLEDLNWMNV